MPIQTRSNIFEGVFEMKGKLLKAVSFLLACAMVLSLAACGGENKTASIKNADKIQLSADEFSSVTPEDSSDDIKADFNLGTVLPLDKEVSSDGSAEDGKLTNLSNSSSLNTAPKGEYNKGVVLVKFEDKFSASAFGTLSYTSAEALFDGSKWYSVTLSDKEKTEEAVTYLTELGKFEKVDYDYIMGVTGPKEDAEENPNFDKQVNLGLSNIPNGWTHNGKAPGGSPDVVVAVIDTGVDYNHLDLRNNIWVNSAEIAGNGKDDDGNGYIDDINGWDCVGNDKDPMDDNGHGTHVAGIIAAENNKEGGIGVAYNCKVMVLKAGNSSGYFNNSDIAEAIQYAYMNGASVINMSFGGSQISVAVEEALENAYTTSVLVAAAGNDGACNNLSCKTCDNIGVSYPAALPYVIGVMSTDKDGKHASSFSNYDHNPYDSIEYEVYAVGEGVGSTWPSNKYACLNGTSMAAPTVSGIAALLRSYYTDREVYSTKFIQSQIVNTGTVNPHIILGKEHVTDEAHSVADVVEALTKLPKPAVNLYDYYIDDSTAINAKNNGNGVVDAGETVRLHISLHNRGGVASDVNVSIDTYRSEIGNEALTDPYFTFVNNTIALSDIGTYSVRESGDKYFEIIVSPDCPNDYLADFNIRFTYKNGMDEKDNTVYEDDGKQKAQFNVSRGFHLPATITEDTTYTADRLYIVGEDVIIPEGVTVTFEEGCEIQFYDDREYYNSPKFIVYGTLNFSGTKENLINITPNQQHYTFVYGIVCSNSGKLKLNYVDSVNLLMLTDGQNASIFVENSFLKISNSKLNVYSDGTETAAHGALCLLFLDSGDSTRIYKGTYEIKNSFIDNSGNTDGYSGLDSMEGCYYLASNESNNYVGSNLFNARVVLKNNIFHSINVPTFGYTPIVFAALLENNIFSLQDNDTSLLMKFSCLDTEELKESFATNSFATLYQQYSGNIIENYYDATGNPIVDIYGSLLDPSLLWPYAVSIEMFDKDGNAITTVGREEIKVRVTFNRPMDTTKDTFVTFGTIEPYGDYRIDGEYISDTVWEGTYTLKAQIENGQNFLKVNNACAAENPIKTVFGEYQLFEFTIDTTAAMSMNLQAVAKEEGIQLTFAQDDYDTLLGYNIYRSTEKDGNYVKLNPAILLPDENTFLDENAEPGKTYWYTYTVVLSNFTESNPAGKVMATAFDTMSPSLYHTPVNQAYENNNLVITATATDNVAISKVTLYYRTAGATEWKTLAMAKKNDRFSATIFGSDVTLAGLEYYVVATDGINTVQKGSAETPYTVVVKSADSLLGMGDVDGNGTVTVKDALMLMQCLNGDLILADDAFKRADLNGDGILSSVEALRILQYVNGKLTTLEM